MSNIFLKSLEVVPDVNEIGRSRSRIWNAKFRALDAYQKQFGTTYTKYSTTLKAAPQPERPVRPPVEINLQPQVTAAEHYVELNQRKSVEDEARDTILAIHAQNDIVASAIADEPLIMKDSHNHELPA